MNLDQWVLCIFLWKALVIPFSLKGLLGEKIIVILLEYSFRNCIVKICLYFKYLLGLKTELLTGLQNAKFTETQIVYAHV